MATKPIITQRASFTVRLPIEIVRWLEAEAAKEYRTRNKHIEMVLTHLMQTATTTAKESRHGQEE